MGQCGKSHTFYFFSKSELLRDAVTPGEGGKSLTLFALLYDRAVPVGECELVHP